MWATEARDAYGYTTCYDFDDDQRLTMIRRYRGQSDLELYSLSRLFWGPSSKNQQANLICQTLQASDNSVHSCRLLEYDEKHNVTKESLVGNLTGRCGAGRCSKRLTLL